jgi:hypothetical protein
MACEDGEVRLALIGLASVVVLFGLDRALASIAVETHAAGVLLSPGGVESLSALVVALAFLLTRVTFAVMFCATAMRFAWEAVRWAWPASPTAADS